MILNVRNGILTMGSYRKKTFYLTHKQKKFLMLLSDNENHSKEEIIKFMGYKNKRNITVCISSLKKKNSSIIIKNRTRLGYKLENIVLLTY